MESIFEKFKNMHSDDWDYYIDRILENPFNHRELKDYKGFILKYYFNSGKMEIIEEFNTYAKFKNDRAIHTVSIFFLGIIIWKSTKLNSLIFENKNNLRGNPTFQFVWFLSILFHDFAESIEEEIKCDDLNDLYKKYNIDHRLTDYIEVGHIDKTLFLLIKKYYYYRRYSMKSIDHGILAGIYMYDRLYKIREKKASEGKVHNGNELSWDSSLIPLYATAAGAIACHNMWTTKKRSKEHSDYIKFELDALVRPTFKKIKSGDNSLLFLFGLVDTIDPIKYFMKKGFDSENILNRLDIDCSDDYITIINKDIQEETFKQYRNDNKRNFEGWLDLTVEKIIDNKFRIRFNN